MKQLHPKAVWLFFLSYFTTLIPIIIILGYFYFLLKDLGSSERSVVEETLYLKGLLGSVGILVIFLIIFFYVWARLSYHYYRYELREDGFRKEYGVIWKRYVTIPYERIQNVDILRGIWARLLGLSDIHVQTAGMSVGYGRVSAFAEGRLPGLARQEAEAIRDELVRRARQSKGQGV